VSDGPSAEEEATANGGASMLAKEDTTGPAPKHIALTSSLDSEATAWLSTRVQLR
jgi:hypothetical protein